MCCHGNLGRLVVAVDCVVGVVLGTAVVMVVGAIAGKAVDALRGRGPEEK